MNKIVLAGIVISVSIGGIFVFSANSLDKNILAGTFSVSAVYYPNDKIVKITYHDNSNGTTLVTLEILGMNESFRRTYDTSSFQEKVQLSSPPKYGWSSIPVTFLVQHNEFGQIEIKTEISPIGEPAAEVIYSKP
ncbi:MAG: hypothetical protein ACE5JT_02375 [Nitrosopumilaceae archaeon]